MNTNGFLAPALGIAMWHAIWCKKYPMDFAAWHTQPSTRASRRFPCDSASDRYTRWLDDGQQWQYPDDAYAAVWAEVTRS